MWRIVDALKIFGGAGPHISIFRKNDAKIKIYFDNQAVCGM